MTKTLEVLNRSLKCEVNPMSSSQLEIPVSIALRRKIIELNERIAECNQKVETFEDESSNKLIAKHEELDKLQRKLRNYILNIGFRRNQLNPNDEEIAGDLNQITYDQETISQSLYQEFE